MMTPKVTMNDAFKRFQGRSSEKSELHSSLLLRENGVLPLCFGCIHSTYHNAYDMHLFRTAVIEGRPVLSLEGIIAFLGGFVPSI